MPLPKPKKDEKQGDFISRCMGNDAMKSEFDDNKQRLAVCYSIFKRKDEEVDKISQIEKKLDMVSHIEDLQEKKKNLGYKIVGWDASKKRAFSLYDTKLDVEITNGKTYQYKKGTHLGTSRDYVIDYFSGGTDYEDLLLTYEYDERDLLKGDPEHKNSEIIVKKAKLIDIELLKE